jgi:hypothetical protein
MGLLDKIKGYFTKETIPDETRLLLSGVENIHELRRGLDEIVTRNEVELKEVEREIDKLEKIEVSEKDRVKGGQLTEREKLNALRYVKRLRARMDSYQKRHKIHQENIDLHLALLDRIDEMEAMELKAIKQEQIEEIAVDYEERVEKHKEIVAAGRIATEHPPNFEDAAEKRELEALEREIMGENAPKEELPEPTLVKPEEEKDLEEDDVEEVEEPVAEKPVVEGPAPDERRRAPLRVEPTAEERPAQQVNVPTERPLELE